MKISVCGKGGSGNQKTIQIGSDDVPEYHICSFNAWAK